MTGIKIRKQKKLLFAYQNTCVMSNLAHQYRSGEGIFKVFVKLSSQMNFV